MWFNIIKELLIQYFTTSMSMIKDVKELLKSGGFKISKQISSSKSKDDFTFTVEIKEYMLSRGGILSTISDPLGFIAQLLLRAKLKLNCVNYS